MTQLFGRERRRKRIRKRIKGTPERPRLNVFRSNKHIYAQIIDDTKGHTLVSASTLDKEFKSKAEEKMTRTQAAYLVGELLAKKALEKNIKKVCFDRAGYKYHGRVKALAEGARKGGLEF